MNSLPYTALLALALACAGANYTSVRGATVSLGDPIQRLSHIDTTVTDEGGGVFRYEYSVFNDSPAPQWVSGSELQVWPSIIGYEVPLDHPSVVWNIISPPTWNHRFFSAFEYEQTYGEPNPFQSAYVLQWYDEELRNPQPAKMIVPAGFNVNFGAFEYEPFANGFGFSSLLSPVDGPYATLWLDFFRNIGDPPLPGGNISGGALPYIIIPEIPATGLVALGCLAWVFWRRGRHRA